MIRRALFVLMFAMLASPAFAQETPFAEGQVWSLSDPAHPEARVRIGRIEDDGRTIHISLWGVSTPAALRPMMGEKLVMQHLPITDTALRASVGAIVHNDPAPEIDFEEGYRTWREAQGGVFTLTVPEIVTTLVATVAQGQMTPVK